jgi:hypothetical protein
MTHQLEDRLGQALNDLAENRPYSVDLDAIERRGRRATRRTALTSSGVTLTVAAVVAAAIGIGSTGGSASTPKISAASPAATPLTQLADYVLASDQQQVGDATKVIRTTTIAGKAATVGADLYADDGDYFYSDDPAALAAQVKAHTNLANGVFGRDVAAAQFAANGGDLATAQKRMAVAALDPGTPYSFRTRDDPSPIPSGLTGVQKKAFAEKLAASSKTAVVNLDGSTWSNSLDALIAGAGRPDVRAGVLKILSTLPNVTVTNSTIDGKPTLTLTETDEGTSTPYVESLVIDAKDGVPVRLNGGSKGGPSVTISYQVNRVTLSTLG